MYYYKTEEEYVHEYKVKKSVVINKEDDLKIHHGYQTAIEQLAITEQTGEVNYALVFLSYRIFVRDCASFADEENTREVLQFQMSFLTKNNKIIEAVSICENILSDSESHQIEKDFAKLKLEELSIRNNLLERNASFTTIEHKSSTSIVVIPTSFFQSYEESSEKLLTIPSQIVKDTTVTDLTRSNDHQL